MFNLIKIVFFTALFAAPFAGIGWLIGGGGRHTGIREKIAIPFYCVAGLIMGLGGLLAMINGCGGESSYVPIYDNPSTIDPGEQSYSP